MMKISRAVKFEHMLTCFAVDDAKFSNSSENNLKIVAQNTIVLLANGTVALVNTFITI